MNPVISDFASDCFYKENENDSGLDSSEVKTEEKQANLGFYKDKPLVFLDMSQSEFGAETDGISKSRKCEAEFVIKEAKRVLDKDAGKSVGIITFYKKQADLISGLEVNYLTDEQKKPH